MLNGVYEPPSMSLIMFQDYRKAGLKRFFHTFKSLLKDNIEDQLPNV